MSSPAVPPFSLNHSKYDQSTFLGRFWQLSGQCDPRCLLPSVFFGMSLKQSIDLINQFKANVVDRSKVNDQTLWTAKKVYNAAVHPDTGDIVPGPFRMSGYAVFNTPVIVAMLLPGLSLPSTVLVHSINQTHNACVNYANRNASQPTPVRKLLEGYAGALVSSVSIAVGLKELVKRSLMSENRKSVLLRFVSFPAVAAAAICNILLMRRNELVTGITVLTPDGTPLGASQAAAKKALGETAITRFVLPAPLLILPPLLMMSIEKTPLLKRYPRLSLPVQSLICTIAFVVGLPMAIALFPQEGTMPASDLEPELQDLAAKAGAKEVKYNKGL